MGVEDAARTARVARAPALAFARLEVGAGVALAGIVAASFLLRTAAGWLRATPVYFPDEYIYAELGRSIAESGRPLVRGVTASFPALLQPIITAPAWLFEDVEVSYRLVQATGALLMSLAAVPVFFLARRLGVDHEFEVLSQDDMQKRCASPTFRSAVFMPDAATVQPARLARGLRRVLIERGVRIFEETPVLRFRGGTRAEAETPRGGVTATAAVIGLGAYAASLPAFRRAILPRSSTIVLTAPGPERLEDIGWTGGEGVYDYRSTLHYLRTTPDGRIAFGGAGARTGLGTGLGPRMDFDEVAIARLVRDLHRWFPSFRDVPIECAWGGPIDVTGLHLPFLGTLPSGNLHYALGFTGGGVGPCHLAGRILSGLAVGAEDDFTRLPIVGAEPKPFPPEPLRSPGALLVTRAIMRKDDAEDLGGRALAPVDFLARIPRRLGYNLGP